MKKPKINRKDKILVNDFIEIAADSVVDAIAESIPLINIPYKLSKALYGAGMKLRQQRVLEWVEMVRDNPSYFSEQVLGDEAFQDGFVIALEKYLTERNTIKRTIFRNIFLGFSQANDKAIFPLEKFTHTLSQLSQTDVLTLRDVDISKNEDQNYQIYGNNPDRKENIHNLVNLGLLFDTTGTRGGYHPANSPFVRISPFGLEFVKYIKMDR
ncbi:MAG: hypothetical protein H6774_00745 [Pseudomonadales bacterium]|nr:hypothetical protein [Pseudomonadales bacterium]